MVKLNSLGNAGYRNMLVFQAGNTRLDPGSKQAAIRIALGKKEEGERDRSSINGLSISSKVMGNEEKNIKIVYHPHHPKYFPRLYGVRAIVNWESLNLTRVAFFLLLKIKSYSKTLV